MGQAKLLGGGGGSRPKNAKVIEGYSLTDEIPMNTFVTQKNRQVASDANIGSLAVMLTDTVGICFTETETGSTVSSSYNEYTLKLRAFRYTVGSENPIQYGAEVTVASNIIRKADNMKQFFQRLSNSTCLFTYGYATDCSGSVCTLYRRTVKVSVDSNLNITLEQRANVYVKSASFGDCRFYPVGNNALMVYSDYSETNSTQYYFHFLKFENENYTKKYEKTIGGTELKQGLVLDATHVLFVINYRSSSTNQYYVYTLTESGATSNSTNVSKSYSLPIVKVPNQPYLLSFPTTTGHVYRYTLSDDLSSISAPVSEVIAGDQPTITNVSSGGYYTYGSEIIALFYSPSTTMSFYTVTVTSSTVTFQKWFEIQTSAYLSVLINNATLLLAGKTGSLSWAENKNRINNTYVKSSDAIINGLAKQKLTVTQKGKIFVVDTTSTLLLDGIPVNTVNAIKDGTVDEIREEVLTANVNTETD